MVKKKYRERRKSIFRSIGIVILIFLVFSVLVIFLSKKFFIYGAYINGVDCSFCSVEGASSKLAEAKFNEEIVMIFDDYQIKVKFKECIPTMTSSDIRVDEEGLKAILNNQLKELLQRNWSYELKNIYSIDVSEEKIEGYLKNIPIFGDESNKPKNAYLDFNDENLLYVVPEVYGVSLDLEDAVEFMSESLSTGQTTIDFRELIDRKPEVLSNDTNLNQQKDEINSILRHSIYYELPDGNVYTLNSNIMREWVYIDEYGNYRIELKNNISQFVDLLSEKGINKTKNAYFNATNLGQISISLGRVVEIKIDKEKEMDKILQCLQSDEEEVVLKPNYIVPDYTDISTYVELDLSRQEIWMYVDGKCIANSPFVSGDIDGGHATPVGVYYLTYKTTDTYLRGYNDDGSKYSSYVNFWMPFNGDIGLHDAGWRNEFGGDIYLTNGSHGCINLPYNTAKIIYENINSNIPIILYAS